MNIPPQAAHRPSRRFPNAPRKVLQPEVKKCPYCGVKLKSTGNLYINREVQTMDGPLNVRAYGWCCTSEDCPCPDVRYRASRQLWRISLPKFGYGLDVIAYIGWQHDQKFRQFCEIQQELQLRGIQISERHVGRLYRQYLALLGGLNEQKLLSLKKVNQKHGGVVWALDALQPDQDGTQLYVLYEAISETTVAAAWLDKRDSEHLIGWLEPITKLKLTVFGTLSDGEEAEIQALKTLWPYSPHQMCLTHFLGNCAKPLREADKKLQQALRQGMGQLPSVPGDENSAQAGPAAATIPQIEPMSLETNEGVAVLASANNDNESDKDETTTVLYDNDSVSDVSDSSTTVEAVTAKVETVEEPISQEPQGQQELSDMVDSTNQLNRLAAGLPAESGNTLLDLEEFLTTPKQEKWLATEIATSVENVWPLDIVENKSTQSVYQDSVSPTTTESIEQQQPAFLRSEQPNSSSVITTEEFPDQNRSKKADLASSLASPSLYFKDSISEFQEAKQQALTTAARKKSGTSSSGVESSLTSKQATDADANADADGVPQQAMSDSAALWSDSQPPFLSSSTPHLSISSGQQKNTSCESD
jgi:hypothetical protein